jgi:YfiH family protein
MIPDCKQVATRQRLLSSLDYRGARRFTAVCYIQDLDAQTFNRVSGGGLEWLESARLSEFRWLVHAFSTRRGGVSQAPCAGLNLGFTESDQRERVEQNRQRFFDQVGGRDFEFASVRQVHSSQSFVVKRAKLGLAYRACGTANPAIGTESPPAGDALITAEGGILLTIRIADCLPVLIVEPRQRTVAAVHAGWRGALARIIEKAVGEMRTTAGSDPQGLIAAVGPSIRACCYEVGEEVLEAFHGGFTNADAFFRKLADRPETTADGHARPASAAYPPGPVFERLPVASLDLTAVARSQLLSAGLSESNILVADYCTACRTDLFFSHRKEGGRTGRQAAAIGIREAAETERWP